MRILWSMIGLLVLATAVVVLIERGDESPGVFEGPPLESMAEALLDVGEVPPELVVEPPAPAPVLSDPPVVESVAAAPVVETPVVPATESATELAPDSAHTSTDAAPVAEPVVPVPVPVPVPESESESESGSVPEPESKSEAQAGPGSSSATEAEFTAAPESAKPAADVSAASAPAPAASPEIAVRDDGSMLVDGKYVVRGTGTAEDPYRVSWELLVSASQTYRPRQGQTEIPPRVQMLHEKHVRITGYLAFPLASAQVDEALVMLNQWDGCCIGVPPSPYDAIEARLAAPYSPRQGHMLRYGTIEGRLKVDPYIVNEWLVGLYLMEEARLDPGL